MCGRRDRAGWSKKGGTKGRKGKSIRKRWMGVFIWFLALDWMVSQCYFD